MNHRRYHVKFKNKPDFDRFLRSHEPNMAVLIATHPNKEGVSDIYHAEVLKFLGESPYGAYVGLMKKHGITKERILHNGFLNYHPENKVMIHDGRPISPGVSAASEEHVKYLHDVIKDLGYDGHFKDITRRKNGK